MVSMTSIKGMDARHKGMWTYVYRGNRRTSQSGWERTSEGRATTVERAADSRGTLVPRESAARLTPAATPTEL